MNASIPSPVAPKPNRERQEDGTTPAVEDDAPMTIGEASQRYATDGRDSVSPAFREVLDQMIDRNIKTEFANDSYLDALYLTDVMFSRSRSHVRMLMGEGAGGFLEVLLEPFEKMLGRIAATDGGFVRAVVLSAHMPLVLTELLQKFKGTLRVCRASATQPIKHFIVCDSKMARLEEAHQPIASESPASDIKARVYFNEPTKAQVFEQHFDGIWTAAEKFPVNKGF